MYNTSTRSWVRGVSSRKVWLNRNDSYFFNGETGESEFVRKSINKVKYSPLYNSPSEYAYLYYQTGGYSDDFIKLRTMGANYIL